MFKPGVTLAAVALAFGLVACGGSDKTSLSPTGAQDSGAGSGSNMMGQCPTDMMKDITVTLTDTETGINVDFVTTNSEKLETVRTMVQHMAGMASGTMTGGGSCCATGGGMMGGTGGGMMGGTGGGMMGGTGGGMMGGTGGGMMGGTGGGMMGGTGSGDHDSMMTGNCPMMGSGMMGAFTTANATAVNIDNGARLLFTVKEGADLAALRTAVHNHFDVMANGHCPMVK